MTARVETKGSKFLFVKKDGQLYFLQGLTSGTITQIRGKIAVGKPLEFDFIPDPLYGNEDGVERDRLYLRTTPVEKIEDPDLILPR